MYVILINEDGSLYGSHKERIMQRSKLVDNLIFVVDPTYKNTYDMTGASVLLEYVLPVSREYRTEYLILSDERYNDCFLQYKLPLDTSLTKEAGKIELQVTFAWVEMDENGKIIQHVRKTSPTTIEVIPISAWSDLIPDSALGGLDQRLIILNEQMQALNDYMDVLDNNQVDNLIYDATEDTLQLSSKGEGIGDKVSVKEMLKDGTPVVDLDSDSVADDGSDADDIGKYNCECADIVQF